MAPIVHVFIFIAFHFTNFYGDMEWCFFTHFFTIFVNWKWHYFFGERMLFLQDRYCNFTCHSLYCKMIKPKVDQSSRWLKHFWHRVLIIVSWITKLLGNCDVFNLGIVVLWQLFGSLKPNLTDHLLSSGFYFLAQEFLQLSSTLLHRKTNNKVPTAVRWMCNFVLRNSSRDVRPQFGPS